jgi:uncharacterized protein (DUF2235 family)
MDQPPVVEPKRKEGSPNPDSESDYGFPRRLVLCLDGTWNQRDSGTNIYHLSNLVLEGKIEFSLTPKAPPPENPAPSKPPPTRTWIQMVYYDEGVGTGLLDNVTGGAFGIGLSENVRQAYEWLVERYREGDEVYIFGFSRGAFTARSLVGMIAKCGLLYRGAPLPPSQLWQGYKTMAPYPPRKFKSDSPYGPRPKPGRFRPLKYLKQDPDRNYDLIPESKMSETEKLLCIWSRRIPIECLAVYDTVGTFGIEALAIPWLREHRAQFHDTELTSLIQHGFHGLAIDEHRANFSHIPWHRATELHEKEKNKEKETYGRIVQHWFIGAHSNIGGSYDDDTLSQRPLAWFIEECEKLNLVFKPRGKDEPDVRYKTTEQDCVPLLPARGKEGNPREGHVCDSYTQLGGGIWRHLIRAKRNYRRIGPLPEYKNGGEVISLHETLDPSVLELIKLNAVEATADNYNPPNLYEYRERRRKNPPGPDEIEPGPVDTLPLKEPRHVYLDGTDSWMWFCAWLFGIALSGVWIARLKADQHCHWLYGLAVVLPIVAGLADYAESYFTHKQALSPDGPEAERRDGALDLLLDVRLVAIGAFLVGTVFFLVHFLQLLWLIPLPLAEAGWLVTLCAILAHFGASKAWAAYPMREAHFGSITRLQWASRENIPKLLSSWMTERGEKTAPANKEDPHRLLPVHRTIWRDMVGFVPAYTIAFCAGLWITFSLICAWWHPECVRDPILGLLSNCRWSWIPAVSISVGAAFFDYVEDFVHLRYLRSRNGPPSLALFSLGKSATILKTGACVIGVTGLVIAVFWLGLLQFVRVFPFLLWSESAQFFARLTPLLPQPSNFAPALLNLAAAVLAIWGACRLMRSGAEPEDE